MKYFERLRNRFPKKNLLRFYSAALMKSGNIYAWGLNQTGQLGT